MSEEFVSGCIQHRDTRHLRLYYDYMDIYSDNEYKAKIIRILETWTDHKRTEWYKTNSDRLEQGQEVLEPDFWITMSYQQFRQYMRHTASEDTLKKTLVELEQAKHIKRRINPDFPYGPPQYLLNAKVIQAALNKLTVPPQVPDLPPPEDAHPLGKNIPPQEITPTQGVELPPPRGEKTYQGGRKNTPTLGGKTCPSNITTKYYLERVIDSDKEESTGEQSDTATSAPSLSLDAAPSPSPQSEIDEAMIREVIAQSSLSSEGEITEEFIQSTIDAFKHRVLVELRARPGLSEHPDDQLPSETHSQQGDTHDTSLPHRSPGAMAVVQSRLPGDAIVAHESGTALDFGASHGVQSASKYNVPGERAALGGERDALVDTRSLPSLDRTRNPLDRPGETVREFVDGTQQEIDEEWCNAETEHRSPAIPKTLLSPSAVEPGRSGGTTGVVPPPLPGGTSPEQNRDAFPPRSVAVESDLGAVASAPIPPALPEVSPPRTIRATVVSPPPQVLVVSQQFTSIEDWKQAQEAFIEQLRGIWKTASPDFKRECGNWNGYRKQYLDRWLRANPQPTAESLLSPEERRIWQDWQTNYKGPIPLTASDKQALVMLLPINPTREELKAERGWLFSTDDPKKPWYRKIGVSLLDCAKNWGKWKSLQDIPASAPSNPHGTVSGLPRLEPSQEWLEAMGGR